jgi:hypothetical protein
MKICTSCLEEKTISEFYKNKNSRDGLMHKCKECAKAATKTWGINNPEKKRQQNLMNKEQIREATKRWYKEKGREYHFKWRNENREKAREYYRRYCELNKEERRESYRLRRMRIQSSETDITPEWLKNLREAIAFCELCGVELTNKNQHDYDFGDLDHIIPVNMGGKHVQGNVRYICHLCNLQRPKDGSDYAEGEND